MGIAHKAFDFRLRYHCRNGVNNDYVDCAGTDKRFGNFKSLFAGIRLGNKKGIDIDAKSFCINRIESVLNVDKCGFAACFLRGCYDMEGYGCFTGTFRSVDLNYTASGNTADAKCAVKRNGTG